jgi:maltose O-acetyltransferase
MCSDDYGWHGEGKLRVESQKGEGKMLNRIYMSDGRDNRERMLAGDQYLADDPQLIAERARAAILIAEFNATAGDEAAHRDSLLRGLLGQMGQDCTIRPPFFCDYGYQISLGDRTFANWGLVALDVGKITIGDDVQIGPNVQLLTATHPIEAEPRRQKWEGAKPITIGNNVWLGGGVIVCPGVTIGDNTVVGAGSVVIRDLPANVLAVGNPARVVRSV